jgi:hypothetical protein
MRRAHKVASGEPDARIGHGQRDTCTIRHIGSLASRRSGLPVQSRGDLRELLVLMHGDQVAVLTAAMASAVCLQPPRDLLVDKGFTGKPFTAAQACRGIAVLLPPAKGQRQRMPSILRKIIAEWRNRIEVLLLALVTAAWAGDSAARWERHRASRFASLPRSRTGHPGRPHCPLAAQFRCLDLQRLVHRIHSEQPAE